MSTGRYRFRTAWTRHKRCMPKVLTAGNMVMWGSAVHQADPRPKHGSAMVIMNMLQEHRVHEYLRARYRDAITRENDDAEW